MKRFVLTGLSLMMMLVHFSCMGQVEQKQDNVASEVTAQVGVYYFHFSRRCNTCVAVEENSKKAVEALYPEQVKSGEYFFQAVNLDEESGKAIGEKMDIGMQALVVVHGDKKIDITGEGFMYAHDIEKLEAEIKKAVEKALKS
ncbi:MAG: hypothetical protein HGA23_05355 [Bacteroidales bacterium]|nr:hypothetical protein [Bacteroidales bacterium]